MRKNETSMKPRAEEQIAYISLWDGTEQECKSVQFWQRKEKDSDGNILHLLVGEVVFSSEEDRGSAVAALLKGKISLLMSNEKPDRNTSSKEEIWTMNLFTKKVDDEGVDHLNFAGMISFENKQDRADAAAAIRKGKSMFDDYHLDCMDSNLGNS
jgi:hypothetical protein